jgi:hypothetical protein
MKIRLAGHSYEVAVDSKGNDLYHRGRRSSQRGDPGEQRMAEWSTSGPALFTEEEVAEGGGYLGPADPINCDTRWWPFVTLGPLISTTELSTYDSTWTNSKIGTGTFAPGVDMRLGASPAAGNAEGMAVVKGGGSTFGYVIRNGFPAKVDLADMTLKQSQLVLKGSATSVVVTRTAEGTVEVSFGEVGSAYEVLAAADISTPPNTDTLVPNAQNFEARILGVASDRIAALNDHVASGNILTGAISMANPNWNSIATITGPNTLQFNGFQIDGNLWVLLTSNGPWVLDESTGDFFPIIPETDNDAENGKGASTWFALGTVIPSRDGARYQKSGSGQSFGIETFPGNIGEIQGRPTSHAATTRWLFQALYDDESDQTYLIAWRFRQPGDQHPNLLQPFPIAKLGSGIECRFLENVGTVDGVRTNQTIIGGHDDDLLYFLRGRTSREVDDANYVYAAAGTISLTKLRREAGLLKDVEAVELQTALCTVDETVTVALEVDGSGTYQSLTGTLVWPTADDDATRGADGDPLNGIIKRNGFHRLHLVDDEGAPLEWASGFEFRPRLSLERGSTTTLAPRVQGFRLFYRLRQKVVKTWQVSLDDLSKAEVARLEQLGEQRPQELASEKIWVRVDQVDVTGEKSVSMRMTEWSGAPVYAE